MKAPNDTRVLVVDDDKFLRELIVFDFEAAGYDVVSAENGNGALEVFKKEDFDAIISDLRMASGGGMELLENVRKTQKGRTPIFMIITSFSDVAVEESYAKGANGYYLKPFGRRVLITALNHLLRPPLERWKANGTQSAPSAAQVVNKLQSVEEASNQKLFNIGKGGAFMATSSPIAPGGKISFRLEFESGVLPLIEGDAIVRWRREKPANGLPAGVGIEFLSLSDSCLTQVCQYIDKMDGLAFIPRS